ncbi:MAG: hypothetical protein AAB075_04445, partial [Gemmatimonadota bacterium]
MRGRLPEGRLGLLGSAQFGEDDAAVNLGFVTNDPFINRYLIGPSITYHATEVFGLEAYGIFSPDFGQSDWKA